MSIRQRTIVNQDLRINIDSRWGVSDNRNGSANCLEGKGRSAQHPVSEFWSNDLARFMDGAPSRCRQDELRVNWREQR